MYVSEELKKDPEIYTAAMKNDGASLEFVSEVLQDDRELVKIAVSNCGNSLEFASEKLQNDREIVSLAVTNDGWALAYASDELQKDWDICLMNVQCEFDYDSVECTLEYASRELLTNPEFMREAAYYNEDVYCWRTRVKYEWVHYKKN